MTRYLLAVLLLMSFDVGLFPLSVHAAKPPNIVLFFIDDMGYADIAPFGAQGYETPHLSRLAAEGKKFTDFIVPSAVCSASRSALMTGCLPERIGFRGALGPQAKIGISDSEVTLAEICKSQGYAAACFGKWHLGHHAKFLPTRHGFDRYYGLPYSNDMWPFHPEVIAAKNANPQVADRFPPLPLLENEQIVDAEVTADDQKHLTRDYTKKAVEFIRENSDSPFFLYIPHSMVHVPLFSSDDFDGKTNGGPFVDAVQEVDWSVGEVLKTLEELKLDEHTLVIFTSDNGPWLSYGSHAGSAGPLREGKGTSWEGGVRVPAIMRWKGRIEAGTTTDTLASTIDILPTVASIVGASLPDHPIDGINIESLLFDDGELEMEHRTIPIYYADGQLQAIRNDRWKLVFPHTYRTLEGRVGKTDGTPVSYVNKQVVAPELYDLDADVGERHDVLSEHATIAEQLSREADKWRSRLGDSLQKKVGSELRPIGTIE